MLFCFFFFWFWEKYLFLLIVVLEFFVGKMYKKMLIEKYGYNSSNVEIMIIILRKEEKESKGVYNIEKLFFFVVKYWKWYVC